MAGGSEFFKKMDLLFHPESVAIVGVSDKPRNMGLGFLQAHANQGFCGKLYAIHPRVKTPGYDSYVSLLDVPGPVHHVVVCVPAKSVPSVIEDCVTKDVRSAVIFSSGFGEWGTEEGAALQEQVVSLARKGGLRLIGPNCMGFYCPDSGLSFRPDMPTLKDGRISIISQSGGVSMTPVYSATEKGLGFAKSISFGNECDLGAVESLLYLSEDPQTEVICLYIEGTRDADALREALKTAASRKPVLMLKGGRSGSGNRAVQSHTGAMAGASIAWEALCRQTGAILVDSLDEMLDTAKYLILAPRPAGRNTALMSVSGGLGVVFTDLFTNRGFDIPEFSEQARVDLRKWIDNPGTSIRNPLDMAVSFFNYKNYAELLKRVQHEDYIDIICVILAMEYMASMGKDAEKIAQFILKALLTAFDGIDKPVVIVFPETINAHARLNLEKVIIEAGYPVFPSVERCTRALDNVLALRV